MNKTVGGEFEARRDQLVKKIQKETEVHAIDSPQPVIGDAPANPGNGTTRCSSR